MRWTSVRGGRCPWRAAVSAALGTLLACLSAARTTGAAEKTLDFTRFELGRPPADFRASLTGTGQAPEWRVVEVPTANPLPSPSASPTTERYHERVLAQVSEDATDEHFPLLIYQPEIFSDFTASLKFRTSSGRVEQMAGLAFRLQDERNYYVVRASSLGNSFRFYKFVEGVRSEPIGPEVRIPAGEWHVLEVECKGNSVQCRLDGREVIPLLTDTSFTRGRLALWTKSDSVSHFANLRVVYDLVKTLPQRLVESTMSRYPRLLGVTVFAREEGRIRAVASSDPGLVGTEASPADERALVQGEVLAGTARDHASAVFPVHDRNGDPVFAIRLKMRTFAGQTDSNIAARGRPIIAHIAAIVGAADRPSE